MPNIPEIWLVCARLAVQQVPLDCPRCGRADEHDLAALQRTGSMRCGACGGVFRVDTGRLARMADALRGVDALLGRWTTAARD